ncbi:unnamed protein product [marine sediment metagenome]|uniref:YgiT-type zinc finger domain-containing protein n=1 Tax=marine sediment metagenome TaxID=412755 RepID=X0S6T4_9ZZZZ
MHNYDDCSLCGGQVSEDKVELEYRYQGNLYIFQNVLAGVCQQCGEKYLPAKVAKEIEHRIRTKEKWDKTISVPVDVLPDEVTA